MVVALAVVAGLSACTDKASVAPQLFQVFAPEERRDSPDLAGDLLDGSGTYDPTTHAGQVLVVNFWASWCGPCVGEAPELEAVYAEHGDGGVSFLGVNVRDEVDAARAFARQHTTYPSVFDPSSRLALGFEVHPNAIPATIVLDREGRVAAVARAAIVRSELEPVIAALLKEPA